MPAARKTAARRLVKVSPAPRRVESIVRRVARATPLELVSLEREGVDGRLLKDLAQRLSIPSVRLYAIVGIPKATAEKKAAENAPVGGASGQAALGLLRLVGIAQELVAKSTAAEARGFDAARWLGAWIEQPQPALGGRKPADLLDTPSGLEIVARTLGALESGGFR